MFREVILIMVQVLKEEIRERIYNAAVQEFFEKNYYSAKMRDIAQRANVPTGLIYSYFKNKEKLFAAVVEPVYKEIIYFLENEEDRDREKGKEKVEEFYSVFTRLEIKLIMEVFKKRKQALILLDKSEGTDYENIREDIVYLLEKHIREHLSGEIKNIDNSCEEYFYHILTHNMMERIVEIFRHFEDIAEAEKMMEIVAKQYFFGLSYFMK